jgi:hypothetical protein
MFPHFPSVDEKKRSCTALNRLRNKGGKADFFGFESQKNPKIPKNPKKSQKILKNPKKSFLDFRIYKIPNPLFPP